MNLNWVGQFYQKDGYGRFNYRLVNALREMGVAVKTATPCDLMMPPDMQSIDWNNLTITCLPPSELQPVPGRHWLYSMTEGSKISNEWAEHIKRSGVERVIVPCVHNKHAFWNSGVEVPISVVPGGVNPDEFSAERCPKRSYRPYTFLTFADRGNRKGWEEVWAAFYLAFGGKTTGVQDVRLLVKVRASSPSPTLYMSKAEGLDERVSFQRTEEEDMRPVYMQADCLALPSRSEGWGMIQREAACTGLPVITQKYSGLDDGYTEEWALVVSGGRLQRIPEEIPNCLGEWMIVDVNNLAQVMKWAYHSPETAFEFGRNAAEWIRKHQTWQHSAQRLIGLVTIYG